MTITGGFDGDARKALREALDSGWVVARRSNRDHVLLHHPETGDTHSISRRLGKRSGRALANTLAKIRNPKMKR